MEVESQLMNFLTFGPVIINNGFSLDSKPCPNWCGNLKVVQPGSSSCFICLFPCVRVFIGSAHFCLEPSLHLYLDTFLHCPSFHLAISCTLSSVSFSRPSLMRIEITVSSGPSLLNRVAPV